MNKKRVLFIEDEIFRNKAMFAMLKFYYDADWAESPKNAYNLILKSPTYDVIILDIMLPVDDFFNEDEKILCNKGDDTGLVLAEKLSLIKKSQDIPIILGSARNQIDTSNLKNIKQSLVKPFYYQELRNAIENILK